tara:strand:+ start:655 stop:1860 length:1206 start_codon:yes stop_codon:yes gene_type:complete
MSNKDNNLGLTFENIKRLDLIEHTQKILNLNSSETIKFYIDKEIGIQNLDRYYINSGIAYKDSKSIEIDSRVHSTEQKNFIRSVFNKLDDEIDLDFKEMDTNNGSEIDIYLINYSSNFESNTVGQVIKQEHLNGAWWDVFWKDPNDIVEFGSLEKNTIVHEIGHSLGLGHPFNDPFNENFTSSDTVMSYNVGANGWDEWFSDIDLKALKSIWGREDDLGSMKFDHESKNYKYKVNSSNSLFIKTELGYEDINNLENLVFDEIILNIEKDIKSVFNELKGIDHITGKIYRLYNAALGRFPDIDGFRYWKEKNISGENDFRQTSESFIHSDEFFKLYPKSNSDNEYISSLYKNVLNREPDLNGFSYWSNQLQGNYETRSNILISFSESHESKAIFSTETSIFA